MPIRYLRCPRCRPRAYASPPTCARGYRATPWDGSVYVPEELPAGDYRMRIALLDPRTHAPALRLAVEGRETDGWYALGTLAVR